MKTLFLFGAVAVIGIILTGIVLKWIVGVAWTLLVYGLIAYVIYAIYKAITGKRGSNRAAS